MAKKTILLVDDTAKTRQAVRTILERGGFAVLEACDAEDAMAQTKLHPPDLIILDVMMPGRSGLELAASLKSRPEYKGIPILLFTGVPTEGGKGEEYWKGRSFADDFLSKPCKPRDLLDKVGRLLGT
jgi:two-component system phosphate regulon response regulator PhoB